MVGVAPFCLALIAVIIGIVAKLGPELFLYIPSVGFVPFMLAGGNRGILPPYFDTEPFDNPDEWLRDGDIVVATGAKAGTTWLCYCMDAVRRKGSDEVGLPYTDIMYTTPWMEMTQVPGQSWQQRRELYNSTVLPDGTRLKDYWDNPAFPFRIFKSHYFPKGDHKTAVLPVRQRPKVKFIMASRNPWEVAKSIHSFFPQHTAEFQKMWGGFPPSYDGPEAAMKALLPGGELEDLYFSYVKHWWPYTQEPNVLALHYSDMVNNGAPALVDKLASFAGIALTVEEKGRVATKCGLEHMKQHGSFFDYKLPLHPQGQPVMKASSHINKGKAGGGEDGIGKEALDMFEQALEAQLTDPKLKTWAMQGGEL